MYYIHKDKFYYCDSPPNYIRRKGEVGVADIVTNGKFSPNFPILSTILVSPPYYHRGYSQMVPAILDVSHLEGYQTADGIISFMLLSKGPVKRAEKVVVTVGPHYCYKLSIETEPPGAEFTIHTADDYYDDNSFNLLIDRKEQFCSYKSPTTVVIPPIHTFLIHSEEANSVRMSVEVNYAMPLVIDEFVLNNSYKIKVMEKVKRKGIYHSVLNKEFGYVHQLALVNLVEGSLPAKMLTKLSSYTPSDFTVDCKTDIVVREEDKFSISNTSGCQYKTSFYEGNYRGIDTGYYPTFVKMVEVESDIEPKHIKFCRLVYGVYLVPIDIIAASDNTFWLPAKTIDIIIVSEVTCQIEKVRVTYIPLL